VLDVYTPCQGEHGIADAAAHLHARLAVESRMNPVFVHDPRRGDKLSDWFSLDGNPDVEKDWTSTTIEYVDADGTPKLLALPLTPADFALGEVRFKKHFRKLAETADGVPVHEYVTLSPGAREGRTPFVWSTNDEKRLIRLELDAPIVHLVEERRKYWRTLQHLAGLPVHQSEADHRVALAELQQRFQDSVRDREGSMDQIARAMSELAASSNAPPIVQLGGGTSFGAPSAPAAPVQIAAPRGNGALVTLAEEDMPKCTNCKTCYQDAGELFEKTKIVVDGQTKEVGRLIPGVLEHVTPTPDLISRIARVAANCDAEIIR
jgi:pyruvate-ferredoxin/flavodoxin oxidoreductase